MGTTTARIEFSSWEDITADALKRIVDTLNQDKCLIVRMTGCLECEISLSKNGSILTDVIYNLLMAYKGAVNDRPNF